MEQSKVNLFDSYFEYVAGTEPPAIFHRWSIIACAGAFLGRQLWFPFGPSRIFANQYVMFIGDPGTRKSTAIKRATRLIGLAGYDKFGANKTSMEKFLLDLQDDGTEDDAHVAADKKAIDVLSNLKLRFDDDSIGDNVPREMFVAADEFNNFIGSGNIAFQSLLGELWDWDEPTRPYKQRLKNSRSVSIYQPTISILAGNTPSSFADCFPLTSIGQGFMSRLILLHAEPSGIKITFPKEPSKELTDTLVRHLVRMKTVCVGPATMTRETESALDLIYKGWVDLDDQRFRHYSTRRFVHLIKLCLVHAAARLSTQITIQDVLHANTVLTHAETTMPKAIGELGKSRHAEAANKIMQALYTTKVPLSAQDLWKIVRNDLEKATDVVVLLVNLQHADRVQVIKTGTGDAYLAKVKQISHKAPYTDFSILKGKEFR